MTILVPIDTIKVAPERVRSAFDLDYIENLADDIAQHGLYHPLVVSNDRKLLVAGQNRLLAIRKLIERRVKYYCGGEPVTFGMVPVVPLIELPLDELLEVELNENLLRRDITWQERVRGIARLHELRTRQNARHTLYETATEVVHRAVKPGEQTQIVSNALALDRHLEDAEIASAPSEREAFKRLTKKMERSFLGALAEGAAGSKTESVLYRGDCIQILSTEYSEPRFSVVLTDPPYGINATEFGDQAKTAHTYDDSPESFFALMQAFFSLLNSVCLPDAHLYMFCDFRYFVWLSEKLKEIGWVVWKRPLVWDKGNGMLPYPEFGPRNCYETILYAIRGNRRVVKQALSDVLRYRDDTEVVHAAQKPVDLYADLLARSILPGEWVLDPFCGSGPIFEAARRSNAIAVGIEQDGDMCQLAQAALAGLR